jgi:putative endonuclease|tara:strand:- start:38 stop:415 length:378 start_codon:yes stop_codon:yes gene_type:complete
MFFRKRNRPLGQQGEDLAARHLSRNGYAILDRNVHLGRFEIDIIAQEGDTVAFVEVKTRRDADIANPEDNITPGKKRRLIAAARIYLGKADHDPNIYYRFDVIAITFPLKGKPIIALYRNAFPFP